MSTCNSSKGRWCSGSIRTCLTMMTALTIIVGGARAQNPGDFDPSLDMSSGASNTVRVILPLEDGRILVGGDFLSMQGASTPYLVRLHADGTVDNSFDTGAGPNGPVYCILPFSSGRYFIGGLFTEYDGVVMNRVALIDSDGSLDISFGSPTGLNAIVRTMSYSYDLTKILIGGEFTSPFLGIARYDFSGALDNGFNPGTGIGGVLPRVSDMLVLQNSIVIAGNFTSFNGNNVGHVAQVLTNGTFDPSLNQSGSGANNPIHDIEPLGAGQLILSGLVSSYNGNNSRGAVIVNADLGFALSFISGFNGLTEEVFKMHRMSNDKLIVGGQFSTYGITPTSGLIRLNSNLTVDQTFRYDAGRASVIEPTWDGRFLIGGSFVSYDGNTANNLARIYGDSCFSRLTGTVTLDGQPISAGKVYVYTEQLQGAGYAIADSTDIDNGEYVFENLAEFPVTYILQAVPDPTAYPPNVAVPTFFSPDGPSHEWNDPTLTYSLNSTCGNIDTIDITVLQPEAGIVSPGTGTISGQLRWAENKVAVEDPIPIIDIVVERVPPGNSVFAYTQTDAQGNYTFTDLPLTAGEDFVYGIHVSIPGIPMQNTYLISITEEGQTFTDLDFLADTIANIIYPVGNVQVGMGIPEGNDLLLYPVPMHDRLTIALPQHVQGTVTAEVFDLSGRTLLRKDGLSGPTFTLDCSGLAAGMHLLRITDREGRTFNSEFMVSR